MTIHVSISEAKASLSALVDAAKRGEDVILDKAGVPQARIVPVGRSVSAAISPEEMKIRAERRKAAFGMYKHLIGDRQIDVPPSMTDEELEERWQRKFGPAA